MKWINKENIIKILIAIIIVPVTYDFIVKPMVFVVLNFSWNIIDLFINYFFSELALSNGFQLISNTMIFLFGAFIGINSRNFIKIESETNDKSPTKGKYSNLYSNILLILIIFFGLYNLELDILKHRFDNNITKITPYTSISEIDLLKSNWVRMKTKEDYDKIQDTIEFIIETNNLD